jgi:hypothetical protein
LFLHVWIDLYQGFAGFDIYLLIIALVTLFSAILFKRFDEPNNAAIMGVTIAVYKPYSGGNPAMVAKATP